MLSTDKPRRDRERGASLVEMTLVFFFLLLLLVGVIDFARAFQSYNVITNAAREGARQGSRNSDNAHTIRGAAKAEAQAGGVPLEDGNVDIQPDPDTDPAEPGYPITVTVNYAVDSILGHIIGFDTVPLQAQAEMVVFYQDPPE
jgi:Flp pilus assembly protein TadG